MPEKEVELGRAATKLVARAAKRALREVCRGAKEYADFMVGSGQWEESDAIAYMDNVDIVLTVYGGES